MEERGIFPAMNESFGRSDRNKGKTKAFQAFTSTFSAGSTTKASDTGIPHTASSSGPANDARGTSRSATTSNSFRGPRARNQQQDSMTEVNSNMNRSTIILCIVENRGREVAICTIDTANRTVLKVNILSDNHSYSESIMTIEELAPDEILLHDGTRGKGLSAKIEQEYCRDARILYISRQYFDQDKGAETLTKLLAQSVDSDLTAKYIVLSGAYCLLRYIENCSGSAFAAHSMRIEYNLSGGNRMQIDRRTAVNLELITNAHTGNQKESLFGVINYTKTAVGARCLRENILRPSTDRTTIEARLDIVELLLRHNRLFTDIVASLRKFPDLDRMLTGLATVPQQRINAKIARQGIDTLICINETTKIVPALSESLQALLRKLPSSLSSSSPATTLNLDTAPDNVKNKNNNNNNDNTSHPCTSLLLEAMFANFTKPAIREFKVLIMDVLTESTSYSKSSHEMQHQECFALKSGINGLLDIARKTYLQAVEDIYLHADVLSTRYEVSVKVVYSPNRGHYLQLPASMAPLPPGFTQAVLNKQTISCSTEELTSLSDRATEAITSALTITHELIQDLLSAVREQIDCLFRLTDSVALLDMLVSFADLVALSMNDYSRPQLLCSSEGGALEDGPIVIKAGRHPIISSLASTQPHQLGSSFVTNDTLVSAAGNFLVITGPNGSGKTVYIKQIALTVILAQIGCFVPARHATICIRHKIMSRLENSDDMEHNMSTFMTEMKGMANILNNVTDSSLVLIDELGRGTSNLDGLSIAFAIAETLIASKAMTLFVTHYPQITALANMYPNAKNVHLKTVIDLDMSLNTQFRSSSSGSSSGGGGGGNNCCIKYLREVASGPCDSASGYGLLMAENCAFPLPVLETARSISKIVRLTYPFLSQQWQPSSTAAAISSKTASQQPPTSKRPISAVSQILQHLKLFANSTMREDRMMQYLSNLRTRISTASAKRMVDYLDEFDKITVPAGLFPPQNGIVNETPICPLPDRSKDRASAPEQASLGQQQQSLTGEKVEASSEEALDTWHTLYDSQKDGTVINLNTQFADGIRD